MFRNYFKTAWRNLLKNKTFSAINVLGLAIGIAAFLLIINYLRFEYSFDDFDVNKDHVYRVPMIVTETGGQPQAFAFTYPSVVLITVLYQSLNAALANPVKSLRTE